MLDQHEKIVRAALNTRPTLDMPKSEQPPVPELVVSVVDRAEKLLRQSSCHGNFPTHVLVSMMAVAMEMQELLGLDEKKAAKTVDKPEAKKS